MTTSKIVVLGGGYAGLMAAYTLAEKVGDHADITLVDAKPHFVERIRMHQFAAQQAVPQRAYRDLLHNTAIQFVQGWVTAMHPDQQRVALRTHEGEETLGYDYLIYALGSVTDTESVTGVAEHAYSVGNEADTLRLQVRLAAVAKIGGEVVVVGGGLTGIETATELAESYSSMKVRLVTRSGFGADLSSKGQAYLRKMMTGFNISIVENAAVTQVNANTLTTAQGDSIPFDACIWTGAMRPVPLARQSGVMVNGCGQMVVDASLRSVSHPSIYAIGDAADPSLAIGTPIRMACATAIPMGSYAAGHLAAAVTQGKTLAPYKFTYYAQCISLGRHAALLQVVDPHDKPREQILTGRLAAWVKELICRYTVSSFKPPRRARRAPSPRHAELHATPSN